MPRNGSGVYSLPPGSTFAQNTTIESGRVNAINADLVADANAPRPITAGGTGASSALTFAGLSGTSVAAPLLKDFGGVNVVAGTATAITVTAALGWTAYGTGDGQIGTGTLLTFKAASANTGATTLNVNALGAKAIRLAGDIALTSGAIVAKGIYTVVYDATFNAGAGAWVLTNPEAQPVSALLSALAGLTGAGGSFIRFTGANSAVMQAIVGTVAQSGGIPTGAIIESGSNANGGYIRYAGGIQECWSNAPEVALAGQERGDLTWTYPAIFSSAPVVQATMNGASTFIFIDPAMTSAGASNATLRATNNNSSTTRTLKPHWLAIGRWYP